MNKGIIAWQLANGDTPANVKSHPALAGLNIPKTGSPRNVGIMVTKTLLFAGDGTDPLLDAYDKKTGELLAQLPMPGMQTGLPMLSQITPMISESASSEAIPTESISNCRNSRNRPGPGLSARQTGPTVYRRKGFGRSLY